ncbi:RluA family pseudouridine synthase [Diaphorobacter aerolatus]|uniref:RluA family pseudouridine synthase n=1 Tax=Diaphorobacter aerolatus TaxID=1288495 RepID=A0A7H0GPY6_9BURK|nr:RluA family pseudouridine synthase [Diaphorobacter aerolatus]QNP50352.1 RluA family pseudouridine synthase [Diaphorobacter aerolatus]
MQLPPLPTIAHEPLIPLYEDEYLLAFDKPSGLLCVPGRGAEKQDCLSSRASAQWPDALIVHRLDMATSGIVLLARGMAMQRAMSASFAERRVNKTYEAVVAGRLIGEPGEWNVIDAPILADWPNRPKQIIDPAGKPSLTRWRAIASPDIQSLTKQDGNTPSDELEATRLELQPITGRTHQLRVHLLHLGFPILGDALYAPQFVRFSSERLMLHARVLQFTHPVSAREIFIESQVPF